MRINQHPPHPMPKTHENGPSMKLSATEQLRRCVMASMLWEDGFYVDGLEQTKIVSELCEKISAKDIGMLMVESHKQYKMRHMPLFLAVQLLKKKAGFGAKYIAQILTRPDQMTELLALYWKDGRRPIAKQLKRALAIAFPKFDEYQLQKYNRKTPVKLRDVLRLCHAKPRDSTQEDVWKRLISDELKTPDTWETKLSAGEDKATAFAELMAQNKMGTLAILRNMRNMHDAGIAEDVVADALTRKTLPLLPFQYIAAAKHVPAWERTIDAAMLASMAKLDKLPGTTIVFVDVSGSMKNRLSAKSDMTMNDAASGLAICLDGVCERMQCYSFSDALALVPPRRGMALRDAILRSQPSGGTMLGAAIQAFLGLRIPFDRMVIITDEQIADTLPHVPGVKNYILNVGNYQNGIKHHGDFLVISGYSQASIDYIREIENEQLGTRMGRDADQILPVSGQETTTDSTQWGYDE